ncbi:MAG: REP-associated tyrosine transposase [Candidatus Sulfotelmatobacter sp.]
MKLKGSSYQFRQSFADPLINEVLKGRAFQARRSDAGNRSGFSRWGNAVRPTREHATNTGQTYMVTSSTWGRRSLFGREPWARLLIDTLYHYRGNAYFLHEFVIMPDHIHVILTPLPSLEKAVQFIKGGFSYRAKKELGSNMEVWQKGFSDHRIRDTEDYLRHVFYIRENPVRKHLSERAEEFPYSSAFPEFGLDPVPQGLKPAILGDPFTARLEGAPLQTNTANGAAEGAPSQSCPVSGDKMIRGHDENKIA